MSEQETLEVDPLSDEALGHVAPVEPEPQPAVAEEAPEPVVDAPDLAKTATEVAAEAEPEAPELILGKYKDHEALENAHKHQEQFLSRQAQELAAERKARMEMEARLAALENPVKAPEPVAMQLPEPPADFDWTDPDQVKNYVSTLTKAQGDYVTQTIEAEKARLAEQFQTQAQQLSANQAQQQQQQQWAQTLQQFQANKPPIDWGTANAIQEVFAENAEYGFTPNLETLEVAYQLATNPPVKQILDRFSVVPSQENVTRAQEVLADQHLATYVKSNPSSFTDTDEEGWAAAKQIAAAMSGIQVTPAPQEDERAKARVVTQGVQGTPAPAAPGVPQGIDPELWKEYGGDIEPSTFQQIFKR